MTYHDERDPDLHPEDYRPSGFEQAMGGGIITIVCVLALYGLASILGSVYQWTGG